MQNLDIKVSIIPREVSGKRLLDINVNGFITSISEKETKMETDRAIDKAVIDLVKREFHIKAHDAINILEKNQLPIVNIYNGRGRPSKSPIDSKKEQKQQYDRERYIKKHEKLLNQARLGYHERKQKLIKATA